MRINKITAAAVLAIAGTSVSAQTYDNNWYVGLGGDMNFASTADEYKDITTLGGSKLFDGGRGAMNFYFGDRITDNFGVEAGYAMTGKSEQKQTAKFNQTNQEITTSTKSQNFYVDGVGYLPMADGFDLVGKLGAGYLRTKATMNWTAISNDLTNVNETSSKLGVRVGAGAQYKITDNIGARFMLTHQRGNKVIKSMNTAGLSAFYQF